MSDKSKERMTVPTFYYTDVYTEFAEECSAGCDSRRSYSVNERINTVDKNGSIYYMLKKGSVALYMQTENGNRKLLLICGENMIFPVFRDSHDYKTNHTIEFQVLADAEVEVFSEKTLRGLLMKNPPFMMKTLNTALDILDLYTYDLANLAYYDCKSSLCNLLYLLYRQMPEAKKHGVIRISHDNIACATGHSRPQVSKQLSILARDGVISTGRESIQILSLGDLMDHCTYDVLEES